jgi:hypothetical protein
MDPRTLKSFCEHLILGGAIVAAGSAAGLWLPTGASLLILGLAICRVCWIEDNIHQDLLPADSVPPGYQSCRDRRRGLVGALLGDTGDDAGCPRRLASALRIQAHAWAAFAWAVAGGTVLPAGAPLTFTAGAVALRRPRPRSGSRSTSTAPGRATAGPASASSTTCSTSWRGTR